MNNVRSFPLNTLIWYISVAFIIFNFVSNCFLRGVVILTQRAYIPTYLLRRVLFIYLCELYLMIGVLRLPPSSAARSPGNQYEH